MIESEFASHRLPSISFCTFLWIQWDKEEEERFKAKVVEAYEKEGSSYYSTARLWDDGIIDPADTRKIIGLCVSASRNRAPEDTKFGVFRMWNCIMHQICRCYTLATRMFVAHLTQCVTKMILCTCLAFPTITLCSVTFKMIK